MIRAITTGSESPTADERAELITGVDEMAKPVVRSLLRLAHAAIYRMVHRLRANT